MSENVFDTNECDDSLITTYFKDINRHLHKSENTTRLHDFKDLKDDMARICFVSNLDLVNKVLKVPNDSCKKSSDQAIKYRNLGNKKFQSKDYEEALLFYHKSIILAPASWQDEETPTNKDLTLAYANRSAVFFHLKQYSSCLLDITRAFNTKYPVELQYKLYDRQARCLLHQERFVAANTAFKNAKNALPMSNLDSTKRVFWEKEFAKGLSGCKQTEADFSTEANLLVRKTPDPTGGYNSVFTSLSNKCDVLFNEEVGRYISCKEGVLPGDIVMVEKPFASVLLLEKYQTHCHHCYTNLITPVACDNCSLAVFCHEKCKQEASQSYHRYECSVLQVIHKSGVEKFGHLALRTITVKNAAFFENFRKKVFKTTTTNADLRLKGCEENNCYTSSEYSTIYNLVGHSSLRSLEDLFQRTITAVFLMKCLQKTTFFEDQQEDLVNFIGSLILSHLQTFPCNAHEISELILDETEIATSVSQEIGAGIYSTLSLFNHSCDPDVTRHFYGSSCVVRAIKPVQKGQQLSDNYGAVYAVHDKAVRNSILSQYYFSCQCEACINSWPLYLKINSDEPMWICNFCKCELGNEVKGNQILKCKGCCRENDIGRKNQSVQDATEKYYKGLKRLLECNISSALVDLASSLTVLCENVKLPWRDVNNAQEALKQCFSTMGNCNIIKPKVLKF